MRLAVAIVAALACWSAFALAGQPPQSGGPVQTPPANDQASAVILGSFGTTSACNSTPAATNVSTSFMAQGRFNALLYGPSGPNGSWSATVQLERSFDGGTTWLVAGVGGSGAQAVYNTANQDVSVEAIEPEMGVLYRWHCAAYTSGTVNYRISIGKVPTTGVPW